MSEAPGRPLPLVTAENEFFWTSGADGSLRFQECRSPASRLIHPPAPVCRYCRSRDIGVRAVSGNATLIGFTVNHRFSLPGLPAPYVIAQVAIEEDPRVRLTTNIVGVRSRTARAGSAGGGGLRADRGRMAAAVPTGSRQPNPLPCPRRDRPGPLRRIRAADADGGKVRGQGRTHRDRHVADRATADAAAAGADRAGVRAGRRRRRADDGRHRRPVDLPGRDAMSAGSAKAGSPRSRPRWASGRRGTTAAWRRSGRAVR